RVYLDEHSVSVEDGCIAIACPITGDWVAMTNHTWAFSIAEMKKISALAIWKSSTISPPCRWRSRC
ncbi:glucokinase, partial [Salmonella enterica subsp. enterica serovar Heidelberg str. N4541]